jgi:branched-chain amino acid transport system substrate-binding protein
MDASASRQRAPQRQRFPTNNIKVPGEEMFKQRKPLHSIVFISFLMLTVPSIAVAQKKYDPGASDAEIKIGNIMPYSGPASAYALIGKTIQAYFNKINDEGGVNGRKLKFISYDDALSPPKTVEQT